MTVRTNQSVIVVAITVAPEASPSEVNQAMVVVGLKRRDRRIIVTTD